MTWLARREPRMHLGAGHERQTFKCPKCDLELMREVGPDGAHRRLPVAARNRSA